MDDVDILGDIIRRTNPAWGGKSKMSLQDAILEGLALARKDALNNFATELEDIVDRIPRWIPGPSIISEPKINDGHIQDLSSLARKMKEANQWK